MLKTGSERCAMLDNTGTVTGHSVRGDTLSLATVYEGIHCHWPQCTRGYTVTGHSVRGDTLSLATVYEGIHCHWPQCTRGYTVTDHSVRGDASIR